MEYVYTFSCVNMSIKWEIAANKHLINKKGSYQLFVCPQANRKQVIV